MDALNALNATNDGGGSGREFTSIKSGSKFLVKVVDKAAVQMAYSFGIFKQINSFVAKNPSTRSATGWPTDNLTPWDKAFLYHKNKSNDFNDEHGQEASKYRAKQRFAMAFFDIDQGDYIIVDLSKKQAQAIAATITKYEKKLGKLAFELAKEGTGTATTVSLSPVLDMDDDLTDKQRENFAKAPEVFDHTVFNGIWYEQDEAQMVALLRQAGFDVTLIGYSASQDAFETGETLPDEGESDPLPF